MPTARRARRRSLEPACTALRSPAPRATVVGATSSRVAVRQWLARHPEAVLAFVWLAFATIAAVRFPWHGLWHDDAVYVALGRALATGDYVMAQLPGSPAETRYPPLHPLVLAACWRLGATAERPFLFVLPGLVVAALGIVAWGRVLHVHLRMRAAMRTAALALAAFAPGWLQVLQCAMAEPWLFTLLPLALLLLGPRGRGRPAWAGAVLGLAALAKSIALLPLLAICAQLAWQRRWRAAVVMGLCGFAVVAPWWWHVAQNGAPPSSHIVQYYQGYSGLFSHDLATWWSMLPERLRDLSSGTVRQAMAGVFTPEVWWTLAPGMRTTLVVTTCIAGVVLVLAACWRALRGSFACGAAASLWLVALCLVDSSWRYALPALPVAFALLLRACGRRWWLLAGAAAMLSLPATVPLLQFDVAHSARMWRENVPVDGYAEAAVALRTLPADAVVATEVDAWLHLVTGRRAVMPTPLPEFTPCDRASAEFEALCRREWRQLGVTHALLEPRSGAREREVVLAAWRDGEFVFVDAGLPPGFVLLRRP